MYLGQLVHLGQTPCRRTVGDEGIGEQHHGGEMLQGYLGCHVGCREAVGGAGGSDYGHGALAVAAVEHLQQVGLLALGGQTGRGTATLNVDDDQRQLVDDSQVDGLALQTDAGTRGRGGCQCSGKRGTYGAGASRYLVFTLHRDDATRLVLGQFVQYVGGGSDGV